MDSLSTTNRSFLDMMPWPIRSLRGRKAESFVGGLTWPRTHMRKADVEKRRLAYTQLSIWSPSTRIACTPNMGILTKRILPYSSVLWKMLGQGGQGAS